MKKILICNQKMYLTYDEAVTLNAEMKMIEQKDVDLIVCPNYLNFNIFSDFKLGAQDAFYEDKGAFTSKISAYDLALRGIKYSIIGHSEVRDEQSDLEINLKIKSLLKNSMTPILCIGETKFDKELMKTSFILKNQLTKALKDIWLDEYQTIYIAYEPRYLINGKYSLSKKEILDVFEYIKKVLKDLNITNYKLLYGGSINSSNVKNIISDDMDGLLLGAASVNINELKEIIKCIK